MANRTTRLGSSSDSKCQKCFKKFLIKDQDSIGCDGCGDWLHSSCARIDHKDLAILSKYNTVYWYCERCHPVVDNNEKLLTKMEQIIQNQDKKFDECQSLMKDIASKGDAEAKMIEEVISEIQTLKPVLSKTSDTRNHSFADALQKNLSMKPVKQVANNVRKEKDTEKILIATPSNSFRDSITIKKEFAKFFPLKKLVFAFNTARGNIHLEFLTVEEAKEVLENWNSNCFGDNTTIRKASHPEKPLRAVLIRGVPIELSEKVIEEGLETNFPGVRAKRFIKKDKTLLGTVKLVFQKEIDFETAIKEGLFLDNIYYRAQKFVQSGVHIIRCFKCQKFGHVSSNCRSSAKCGHCAADHSFKDCTDKGNDPLCSNCNGKHRSDSTECKFYLQQLVTVYNARGIEIPASVQSKMINLDV